MKAARFALPGVLVLMVVVALARSDTPTSRAKTLLGTLFAGDYVTLVAARDGEGYTITVVSPAELAEIRKGIAEYDAKRQERRKLEDRVKKARRQTPLRPEAQNQERGGREDANAQEQPKSEDYRQLLRELYAKENELPNRPPIPYRILAVGDDYLTVSDDGEQISIPLHSIREIRRKTTNRNLEPAR